MDKRFLFSALVGLVVFSGCLFPHEKTYSPQMDRERAVLAERDSTHTLTQAVHLNGKKVGYILTFLEVPVGSEEPEYCPHPDTILIKDLDFNNLGFISPEGTTYRFHKGEASSPLFQHELKKNLAYFFENPMGQVEIVEIH
jgi:hypothetical protein